MTLPRSTLYHARILDARQGPTVLSSAAGRNALLTFDSSPMLRWDRPLCCWTSAEGIDKVVEGSADLASPNVVRSPRCGCPACCQSS